LNKALTPINTC